MRRLSFILLCITLLLSLSSCIKEPFFFGQDLPEGTPITARIDFDAQEMFDIQIGTKAAATIVDESRIHDLYVMLFDSSGNKFYGRYFTYEHQYDSRDNLLSQPNEGWFVENLPITNNTGKKTRGVVKISTEAKTNCTLVLLANVSNTIYSLDGKNAVTHLTEISTLAQLQQVKVVLAQDLVNRSDLFLMFGTLGESPDPENPYQGTLSTSQMAWDKTSGTSTGDYGDDFKVPLTRLDAKVTFRVQVNTNNIGTVEPRNWQVFNVPKTCYLWPNNSDQDDNAPFDALDAFFEGTESEKVTEGGVTKTITWYVFSFYMLENRQRPKLSISSYEGGDFNGKEYYLRELQDKSQVNPTYGAPYVKNGAWIYANENATYVKFDMILELLNGIDGVNLGTVEGLTSDAVFTVHLGDFGNSRNPYSSAFDNYNTYRGYSYTYDITVNNSKSIYVEVRGTGPDPATRKEEEPGYEGSVMLASEGIINCDSHYEYHSLLFNYDQRLGDGNRSKYSWYIKTPFFKGGPKSERDAYRWYVMPDNADCLWVKFALSDKDTNPESATYGCYKEARKKYPGYIPGDPSTENNYDPTWYPGKTGKDIPPLLDVNQLVNFLFWQNELQYRDTPPAGVTVEPLSAAEREALYFDKNKQLRFTAFIDEFYYEEDPRTGNLDPNLWRQYVNALPRELHILSDTEYSLDHNSDVILSSHSIVQRSIQTIYNIYAPDLTSLWGTEHVDEMSSISRSRPGYEAEGWPWWGAGLPTPAVLYNDDENGRLNTAAIWSISDEQSQIGNNPLWETFLDYEVKNDIPALIDDYYYQAYSCMTRNRDNNGNGTIDPDELRWYTASINQLVGMWVGNEALTHSARLYQPRDPNNITDGLQWRSETISSTCSDIADPRILRSEEGATKSDYSFYSWWTNSAATRDKVVAVRCLRNIGTYKENGVVKDITEAPFSQMPDQYFDCEKGVDENGKAWPNEDGSYTIRFSRLNSRAIRGYTEGDLPYHDEDSTNDQVYLRFTAQPKDVHKYADGAAELKITQEALNNAVSLHNDYCPPGYRIPSMTELLMMATTLPADYWGKYIYPCRTYFSRGKIGRRQTNSEKNKIGWAYSKPNNRVYLQNATDNATGLRCVKDNNMIGDITGKISVADADHVRLNVPMDIDLNFSSMTSGISRVTLTLNYIDSYGTNRVETIPADLPLGGLTIRETLHYTINPEFVPNIVGTRGFMTVKAVVLNAAGIERTFEAPIRLVSEMYTSLTLLPCEYNPNPGANHEFPLLITAAHINQPVTKWTLRITTPDNQTQILDNSHGLDLPTNTTGAPITYASTIYKYTPGTLKLGTYTFQLEAEYKYGDPEKTVTTRSEEVSMDVLKVNFDPLAGVDVADLNDPDSDKDATTIKDYKWNRQMIEGLDFSAGDFIETDMDISRCVYKPVKDKGKVSPDLSVGLDELLAFGVNDIDWVPWSLHIYYPAVNTEDPNPESSARWLYFSPVFERGTSDKYCYSSLYYANIPSTSPLQIRLDKNGCHWNGRWMDVNAWPNEIYPYDGKGMTHREHVQSVMNRLVNAKTVYIGSVEGKHRSRAIYRFVRVVYNGRYSSTRDGNDSFKEDPVHGGDL